MGDRGDSKGKHQPAGETATTTETATGETGETARGDSNHRVDSIYRGDSNREDRGESNGRQQPTNGRQGRQHGDKVTSREDSNRPIDGI